MRRQDTNEVGGWLFSLPSVKGIDLDMSIKSTGIVRRVDELGRIVLPVELRRTLDIYVRDSMEIYVDGSSIVLKKYEPKTVRNGCGKTVICDICKKEIDPAK